MIAAEWMNQLQVLVARHSEFGVASHLPDLTPAEAWGIFCFLSGLSRAERDER